MLTTACALCSIVTQLPAQVKCTLTNLSCGAFSLDHLSMGVKFSTKTEVLTSGL